MSRPSERFHRLQLQVMRTKMKILLAFITLMFTDGILCNDVSVSTPVGVIKGKSVLISSAGRPYRTTAFYGIPYAEPTHDIKRFSRPIKLAPFNETYDATKPKRACPQNMKWPSELEQFQVSEDCLSLDIFLPHHQRNTHSKAVMIFIHGGAFQYGCKDTYKSEAFAAVNDVIYVTINYRLSAYGFLASTKHGLKGNYGLWDQHLAIQWVHDNIAAFGGDPKRVTLFGESAGAVSVMYQSLYDGNRGMIHSAIAQSGSIGSYWTYSENPDVAFEDLVDRSGCNRRTFEEIMTCLRNIDTLELQKLISYQTSFLPVQDGEFIKYNPKHLYKNDTTGSTAALRQFADINVIMGMNNDEGLLDFEILANVLGIDVEELSDGISTEEFKMYTLGQLEYVNFTDDENVITSLIHQFTDWLNPDDPISRRAMFLDLLKDISYTPSVVQATNTHSIFNGKGKIYMYQFGHKPSFSRSPSWIDGANHMEEIPFVLAFPMSFLPVLGINSTEEIHVTDEEMLLSVNIMKFWTQFAKTGNPNDASDKRTPVWPEYSYRNQTYIALNTDSKPFSTGSHFRREFVNYWTNVFPGLQDTVRGNWNDKTDCYMNLGSPFRSVMGTSVSCVLLILTFMYP